MIREMESSANIIEDHEEEEPVTSRKLLSLSVRKKDVSVRLSVPRGTVNNVRQLWDSIRISLFVIGTALVIFIAARNSITWHLQRFWGASGNYWQSKWEYVHRYFNGDEMAIALWGSFIVISLTFWSFNGFLFFLDLTGRPQFLTKYRIQPDKNQPVEKKKLISAILLVAFNLNVLSLPFFYLTFTLMKWRGSSFGLELPMFQWVLLELVVFILVEEVLFYYSHRFLHSAPIYRRIHKKHHEWTSPVGVSSLYAHPIEHIVSNCLPPVIGPILMGSHIATCIMWLTLAIISTTISHCGYHFPFLPSPEAHDFHHLKFMNNFGMLGVLDRLHGTDTLFRASKAYQRHILLLGLVPLSQQIPDDVKKCNDKAVDSDSDSLFKY